MRLINVRSLEFKVFVEGCIPPYAILSHRWSEGEISYQEYLEKRKKGSEGDKKIQSFCDLVRTQFFDTRNEPLDWAWIDTCCIDKESSAELTEAINSMFQWYRMANVCIVHLVDFKRPKLGDYASIEKRLHRSEWFRRGWTLQELLAPSSLCFYDAAWQLFGYIEKPIKTCRDEGWSEWKERNAATAAEIARIVHAVTKIPEEY